MGVCFRCRGRDRLGPFGRERHVAASAAAPDPAPDGEVHLQGQVPPDWLLAVHAQLSDLCGKFARRQRRVPSKTANVVVQIVLVKFVMISGRFGGTADLFAGQRQVPHLRNRQLGAGVRKGRISRNIHRSK